MTRDGTPRTEQARYRVPAFAWHLERQFGAKVPQCLNCGSHDLWENHARASFNCAGCGMELSDRFGVRYVPADVNVRNPDEEDKPEGRWLRVLHIGRERMTSGMRTEPFVRAAAEKDSR